MYKLEGTLCCPSFTGGMFTANTMSSALEALGMSPPYTASGPAVTPDNQLTSQKRSDCEAAAVTIFNLLEYKIHAKQIMTKEVCLKYSPVPFLYFDY